MERDPSNADALLLLAEGYAHSSRDNDPDRVAALRERTLALGYHSFGTSEELAQIYALMGAQKKRKRSSPTLRLAGLCMCSTRAPG